MLPAHPPKKLGASKGGTAGMSVHQGRMMRSKQLNETTELVCISSAMTGGVGSTNNNGPLGPNPINAINTGATGGSNKLANNMGSSSANGGATGGVM